jgi:FkbM family methyltransferase
MYIGSEYLEKIKKRFFTKIGREKSSIRKMNRFTQGSVNLFGKKFLFHDNLSFLDAYKEIFEHEVYKFFPDISKKTILDCGANMGLSVLYFSLNYPDHSIIAFEPDENIFKILKLNIDTYQLNNVQLIQKAVWDKEEILEFYSDSGMGGRIGNSYTDTTPQRIKTLRLKDFINDDIDFLKIDIEGAESTVIFDCRDVLYKANKVFFEYHGKDQEPQQLHELLSILKENGFHYYIKESSTRQKPFIDTGFICEIFDMAINIFGYKQENHRSSLK